MFQPIRDQVSLHVIVIIPIRDISVKSGKSGVLHLASSSSGEDINSHPIRSQGSHFELARIVSGNVYDHTPGCVTAMINQLKWEHLEYRWLTSRLVMFYKITHDLIDINVPSYLLPGDARTRSANRYRQPTTDKDIYKFSFFPRTTTVWNRLPETTTSANTVKSFRMQLSSSQAAYFTHQVHVFLYIVLTVHIPKGFQSSLTCVSAKLHSR